MFSQVFDGYCKTAELMMQIQQEMFRQWVNPWFLATAAPRRRPEGRSEVMNPRREVRDTPYQSGLRAIEDAVRSTEDTVRSAEDATRSRPHGNGYAHATPNVPVPRTGEGARFLLRAEEIHPRKQFVESGEVRIRKEVVTEHQTIEVPVRREEIIIERHAPAGEHASATDLRPGQEIRISLREERVTVEKRPVVTEEVTVGKRFVQETARVGAEVRMEELRVERQGDVRVCDGATVTK